MSGLTWRCHVCGDERPDDRISVYSTTTDLGGIPMTQNVRHCNDRPGCIEGAPDVDWRRNLQAAVDHVNEAEDRRRRRHDHGKRWIALFGVGCLIAGMLILAHQARAASRPPVPAPVFKAVRAEWRQPADRREAFDVIACETGGTYSTRAANGQYLGLFQMGRRERRICGHGPTARAQARAARCWFDKTGHDWSPWTCA